ncbi:MAG: glycosyltransferase family 4 protein [Pseudomonadales bacterium]|nr:glycosyltransferase family 4 protein [Pseudomonadales bacterium]
MKLGVDARLLSRPLTGIGRYTLEMCRALCKHPDLSLFLYSPAPIPAEVLRGLEPAKIRAGSWDNTLLRQIWGISILPRLAKQDSVDIFWGPSHRLPRFLPSSTTKVVTIHDLVWKYAGETMRPLSRIRERYQMPLAVQMADLVFADSHATKTSIIESFPLSKNKINVVHLGVTHFDSNPSKELLRPLNIKRPYFLFVGTLEPRKNLERLLAAFSQLPSHSRKNIDLVIAGGAGWGKVDIENKVKELKLSSHVHLLGYVSDQTLNALYKHSKFLVMPSLYEGFGLPLVEAMAHGVPVLSSNNSSMPEVAGEAGFLVDPLDVNSIAHGLTEMINNDSLRNNLAAKAKLNVQRFNWDKSAQQFITALKETIKY